MMYFAPKNIFKLIFTTFVDFFNFEPLSCGEKKTTLSKKCWFYTVVLQNCKKSTNVVNISFKMIWGVKYINSYIKTHFPANRPVSSKKKCFFKINSSPLFGVFFPYWGFFFGKDFTVFFHQKLFFEKNILNFFGEVNRQNKSWIWVIKFIKKQNLKKIFLVKKHSEIFTKTKPPIGEKKPQ